MTDPFQTYMAIPALSRTQDGWLWSDDDECWRHARTLREALDAAYQQTIEEWDGDGDFEVYPAYRVNLAAAAQWAAVTAIEHMGNGALETAYQDSPDELLRIEADLTRAFAADIERVCGPWHETLGRKRVAVSIANGVVAVISSLDGVRAEVDAWASEVNESETRAKLEALR